MRFGGLMAVDDVSLGLEPGRITALIGPNGSGKSTLVNVISRHLPAGLGRGAASSGETITGLRDDAIASAGLLRTFQDPRLVPRFTVRENLLLGAHRRYRTGAGRGAEPAGGRARGGGPPRHGRCRDEDGGDRATWRTVRGQPALRLPPPGRGGPSPAGPSACDPAGRTRRRASRKPK